MKRLLIALTIFSAVGLCYAEGDASVSFGEDSVSIGAAGKYVGAEVGLYQEDVTTCVKRWCMENTENMLTVQAVGFYPLAAEERLWVYGSYGACEDTDGGFSGCGGGGLRWYWNSGVGVGAGWDSRREANVQLVWHW